MTIPNVLEKTVAKFILLTVFLFLFYPPLSIANNVNIDAINNPCDSLLSLVNRPSKLDSPCAVPKNQAILEMGYMYGTLTGGGSTQNFPEPVLRIGLPYQNELVFNLPNYTMQSISPKSGFAGSQIGLKHELGYNAKWLGTVEGYIVPKSGSRAFGTAQTGAIFNSIVSYTITKEASVTFMVGLSSIALPQDENAKRVNSINPDLLFAWQTDKWQTYLEFYAQNTTGLGDGVGCDMDIGFLYLLTPKLEVDAAVGQHLRGHLGGFNTYGGLGFSVLLG